MRTIQEQDQLARTLEQTSLDLRIRASGARNRADQAYTELRRRVLSGETTGCPLRDVALAGPFSNKDHVLEKLRMADDHLRLMNAQLALVLFDTHHLFPTGIIPSRYKAGNHFALGVFYDNSLALRHNGKANYCTLPVYITSYEDHRGRFVVESLPGIFDLEWDKQYILGDDDVLAWFADHRPDTDITPILIHFGKMDAPTGAVNPR